MIDLIWDDVKADYIVRYENGKDLGIVYQEVDGFWVYWPRKDLDGFWTEQWLAELARKMSALNKPIQEDLEKHLGHTPG